MTAARIRRVMVVVVIAVGSMLGVTALAGASVWQLAKHLVAEDPGARVGGNTIVVTGKGEDVFGVPDRPNFILALGTGETISAGSKNSELGALGKDDAIDVGNGHELIVGGPDGTVISWGTGHDLVVDTHANATITLESSDDEVILSGYHDHVVCSGHAVGAEIRDTTSDTVSKSCQKDHSQVKQDVLTLVRADRITRGPAAHAAAVSGDGTDNDPYTAACDQTDANGNCTVVFPARTLSGLWANEFVPAYSCPGVGGSVSYRPFPYLANHNYAAAGTTLPNGVAVQGLGSIGVSLRAKRTLQFTAANPYALAEYDTGTLRDGSSATNWTTGSASYRVVLHCQNHPPY